jgi:hypothetical protein
MFDWLNDSERYRLLLWLVGVNLDAELPDGTSVQDLVNELDITCNLPAGLPIARVIAGDYRMYKQPWIVLGIACDDEGVFVRIASPFSYDVDSVSPGELILTGQNTDGHGGFE